MGFFKYKKFKFESKNDSISRNIAKYGSIKRI